MDSTAGELAILIYDREFFKYQILFTDKKYDIMSRKDLGRSFVLWKKIIEGLRRFGFGKFGNATAV